LKALAPAKPTGPGLGFVPELTLPTGTSGPTGGEGGATFTPKLVFDYRFLGGTLAALNAGVRFRKAIDSGNLRLGHEFVFGVGGSFRLSPQWEILAEVQGAVDLTGSGAENFALEGTIGGSYRFYNGLTINASFGHGIAKNWGSPEQRFVAGIGFGPKPDRKTPPPRDTDGDTIPDNADVCPTVPGRPPDGCPEKKAEPIAYAVLGDSDLQPIETKKLELPVLPEVKLAPPPPVTPVTPPVTPPEIKKPMRVRLKITAHVLFDYNKATIRPVSHAELRDVAKKILEQQGIARVRVVGHTDDRGNQRANIKLSQRRSESIRVFLIKQGISASLLTAVGKGPTEPVQAGCKKLKTKALKEECWQKNRRVEFFIEESAE
jgi:outer membrane protein OmpA-like peptidoglycan-associated protein